MSSQDENWRPIQQKGARAAAPLAGEAGRGPGEKEKRRHYPLGWLVCRAVMPAAPGWGASGDSRNSRLPMEGRSHSRV